MFIAQLGRQPEISLAELTAVFGRTNVTQIALDFALVQAKSFTIERLGGTIKCARIVHEFPCGGDDSRSFLAASKYITDTYGKKWQSAEGKITFGLSVYHLRISPRAVQKTGILLKNNLKKADVSLRLIPNENPALSTATSHNNKLGLSDRKVELLVVKTADHRIVIAESCGAQNISAYTVRDRHRPKRDAFVGMLPPKLAQIMINLAIEHTLQDDNTPRTVLDPYCGTGTVLQEALLLGYVAHGTDLSDKMVDYSSQNLTWLATRFNLNSSLFSVSQGDAMTYQWRQPIDAVICETYLGQPFSAPPSPDKLKEVVRNCDHIISSFLKNIHSQLRPETPLCIAIPAWQNTQGVFTHLPLIRHLRSLGYVQMNATPLLYHRPDQVVARELLVLQVTARDS